MKYLGITEAGGVANTADTYSKSDADARFCIRNVPDVPWTQLTLSYATAGYVQFCCKNGIVFIEGAGLVWPAAATEIKGIATGIPDGYRSANESKGVIFTDYGQTPYGMCWAHYNSNAVFFWCKDAVADARGRLCLSYPVLS